MYLRLLRVLLGGERALLVGKVHFGLVQGLETGKQIGKRNQGPNGHLWAGLDLLLWLQTAPSRAELPQAELGPDTALLSIVCPKVPPDHGRCENTPDLPAVEGTRPAGFHRPAGTRGNTEAAKILELFAPSPSSLHTLGEHGALRAPQEMKSSTRTSQTQAGEQVVAGEGISSCIMANT